MLGRFVDVQFVTKLVSDMNVLVNMTQPGQLIVKVDTDGSTVSQSDLGNRWRIG